MNGYAIGWNFSDLAPHPMDRKTRFRLVVRYDLANRLQEYRARRFRSLSGLPLGGSYAPRR